MADDRCRDVFCVRNQITKSVEQHLCCPYCFGRKRETVEAGKRGQFCDWDPDKDPIVFAFPPGTSRNSRG